MSMRLTCKAGTLLEEAQEQRMCAAPTAPSDKRLLRRSLGSGEVVSPARGIYAFRPYWEELSVSDRAMHQIRGLAKLHPDWVFAGPSAGLLHGLSLASEQFNRPTIATSKSAHSRCAADISRIVVTGDHTTTRNGIRVTSFLRTLYDCVRASGFGRGLAIVDSASRMKGITGERLADNLSVICGRRSSSKMVIEVARLADGRSENGGESIARAAMMHLGFVVPDLQREVIDPMEPGRSYFVDFAWDLPDGTALFGELDGKAKYTDVDMTGGRDVAEVLLRERRREAHLTMGSRPVRVMRFSFAEACDLAGFARLLRSYGVPPAWHVAEAARRWP